MPRVARFLAVVAFAAVLVSAPATAAQADVNDFEFESFHSDYTLTQDAEGHAHLHVVETIVAIYPDFDQNRGFYRDIPEYRHGVQLHTSVESVVDEYGQPVPYTEEYYEDFYSVGLGDDTYVQGRQTYVISYDQVDVVEAFANTGTDEFYWDVNGTGWAQPFGRVSMSLRVDPAIAPALTGASACYVLVGECDEPLVATPTGDGVVVFTAASNDLIPNESLTFAIEFQTGTFVEGEEVIAPPTDSGGGYEDPSEPNFWDTATPFILGPAALLISWIAGGTQATARSRRTGPSDIIIPQYTPPEGLNVMVAAYLSGAPTRAFSAQIVDLAVRGNVRLLDHPADSAADFEVELLHVNDLDELETKLLRAIFGEDLDTGKRVPLGRSNTTLGTKLVDIYKSVDKKLKGDGLQGSPRPTVLWMTLFTISVLVTVGSAILAIVAFANESASVALWGIVAAVAFFSSSSTYGKRSTVATLSHRGRELNDHLLGMRDYMQLAEEDRIKYLQSPEGAERVDVDDKTQLVKLYERLLPYAIILGIEEDWAKELSVAAVAAQVPVVWWSSSNDFSAWRLNSSIQNLRRFTPEPPRPVLTKSPSRSGGDDSFWGGWGSGSSSSGWSGSSGSSFSGGSHGGGFSGGGGGGRGR